MEVALLLNGSEAETRKPVKKNEVDYAIIMKTKSIVRNDICREIK
jgi:hypothetical protein